MCICEDFYSFNFNNKKCFQISFYYQNKDEELCNLMIRNDFRNIRTFRSKFLINSKKFYFEVTILTDGLMRIGFAAKQMQIEDVIGGNALSIGIDGFNQCLWINRKKYLFKNCCF